MPLETLVAIDGHTTAAASGQLVRGLLQKSPSEQQPSVQPSPASSPLLASTSAASTGGNGTGENNKTKVVQSTRPEQVQQASPSVPASSFSSSLSAIFTSAISNLSKGEGGGETAAESHPSQSEQHHSPDDISQYFDIAPHVDHSPSLNEVQQLNELEQQEPHLAVSYWQKAKKYPKAKTSATAGSSNSKSCRVDFPSLYELEFNNVYWQKFSTANSSFYLYGAYYDDRWRGGPLPMGKSIQSWHKIFAM